MSSIKLSRSMLMLHKIRSVQASDWEVGVASLNCQSFFVCAFGSFFLNTNTRIKRITQIISNKLMNFFIYPWFQAVTIITLIFLYSFINIKTFQALEMDHLEGTYCSEWNQYYAEVSYAHSIKMKKLNHYFGLVATDPATRDFLSYNSSKYSRDEAYFKSFIQTTIDASNLRLDYEQVLESQMFNSRSIFHLNADELIWHYGTCVCRLSDEYVADLQYGLDQYEHVLLPSEIARVKSIIAEHTTQSVEFAKSCGEYLRSLSK